MKKVYLGNSEFKLTYSWLKFLGILLVAFLVNISLYSQTPAKPDKKEAEMKKLEMQLKTAKANLAKAEKAAAINDSLIENGTRLITEGEDESKQSKADLKKAEKEYNTQIKPINKRLTSKDKEDATAAKTEFKEIDTKYKADVKDLNNKIKVADKKKTTGQANLAKGKGSKKMADAAKETAQASVTSIEDKISALQSGDQPEDTGKKGKKK